ncbi:MAG: hypothetical protein IJA34_13800 [Lachnospiraceae bacterium]|nr:hypothetical protein [Lachnospiraceae bacterium]
MLTIKPPIQLRCRFPMETVHNDLSEKIMGNYTLMNNFIRKEELLYVTTQAPEVYFAEGNNISILNDIKNENKQEIRLDIINHLINRILMSHTDNFSYQDTVYISNVLRKLGIQDVSNFMKQVHRLQEEKTENNQLIDIYEEQRNILVNLFKEEEAKQSKKKVSNRKEKNQYENKYYIHEEIFNRLNTEKVYEDIKNYTQGIESVTKKINNNEIAISEQVSMIQNFNLHKLKQEILNNESPIYYYHANQYELAENETIEGPDAEARISAAILLNLVDNIYSLRLNQIENNSHNWYSVAGALFKSAENTWKRYETNHKEGKKVYSNMYETMVEVINNKKNERNIISNIIREINILNEDKMSLINEEYSDETFVRNNINNLDTQSVINTDNNFYENNVNDILKINNINQNINKEYIESLRNELNYSKEEINSENIKIINRLSDIIEQTDIEETDNIDVLNIINKIKKEFIDIKPSILTSMYTGLMSVVNNEQSDNRTISSIINEIKVLNESSISEDDVESKDELNTVSNIKKIIEQSISYNNEKTINNIFNKNSEKVNVQNINNQNYENVINEINYLNSQIIQNDNDVINRLSHIAGNTDVYINNNITTENIIDNLNKEFTINNIEQGTSYESISELVHTNNISEEENIKNITEITEETLKHFDEINRRNIENYKKMLEIEENRPKVKNVSLNKERARIDALRALENPQEVLMEIVNSENKDEHNEINYKLNEQIYNLFSDETKNIFEQVVRQKNGEIPTQFIEQPIIHRSEEIEEVQEIVNNVINKEFINEAVKRQNVSNIEMIQKPSIKYEINETIKNEINELKNMDIINLYENYFGKEEKVKKKRGRKSKSVIEKVKNKEREKLELQHFMNQAEMEENIISPVKPQIQRTKDVGMIHKVEEQVITEELINTIRNKTVDNVKEETVEHNQIHNVNRNEKTINETVNQIKVSNQENIEEIVKQNVKKQLNQLTDQVYGKIEKKLQTERKRRGY